MASVYADADNNKASNSLASTLAAFDTINYIFITVLSQYQFSFSRGTSSWLRLCTST